MDTSNTDSTMPRRPWGPEVLDWSDSHDERLWWRLHAAPDTAIAPPIRRPRVLLEMPGIALASVAAEALREQGYDVTVCAGPATAPYGCPLTRGLRCPIADQADVIVHDLGLTTPDGRAVWQGHEETQAATPRVLVLGVGDRAPRLRPGLQVITGPLTSKALIEAVDHALAGWGGPVPTQVSTSGPRHLPAQAPAQAG